MTNKHLRTLSPKYQKRCLPKPLVKQIASKTFFEIIDVIPLGNFRRTQNLIFSQAIACFLPRKRFIWLLKIVFDKFYHLYH